MRSEAAAPPLRFGREEPFNYGCLEEFLSSGYAPEPCRTIHLGCQDGRTAVFLARKGYQVLGIDPDRDLLASARERAVMANASLDLMGGDPLALPPLPEESFGLAIDIRTAADVPDGVEREDYLRRLYRLLRRNGVLVSSAPAPKKRKGGKADLRPYAFASPFVSDFTRAGFEVVFEGIRAAPRGDMRLMIHARKPV